MSQQDYYKFAKIYPKFTRLYFYEVGIEDLLWFAFGNKKVLNKKVKKQYQSEEAIIDSIRRTKTVISDLIICNPFDHFATFTFNGTKEGQKKYGYAITDRTDVDICKKKMSKWLKNQREMHGKFEYLIIPEFHKDGKAIHFHALLRSYKGNLRDSGKRKNSRTIFNITSYKLGHSTLVKITQEKNNIGKVANYVKKYITKDMPVFENKKRYWCSSGLIRPQKLSNPNFTPFEMETFKKTYQKNKITVHTSELTKFATEESVMSNNALQRYFQPDKIEPAHNQLKLGV